MSGAQYLNWRWWLGELQVCEEGAPDLLEKPRPASVTHISKHSGTTKHQAQEKKTHKASPDHEQWVHHVCYTLFFLITEGKVKSFRP